MTNQPKWKAIAQIGDASPLEYGGIWVLVDETGVYPPELEILEVPDDEESKEPRVVYRVVMEPHTYVDGVLSDNPSHPSHPVWYADDLKAICLCVDWKVKEIIECFCSSDPLERARAYRAVADYCGWHQFDQYPLNLTKFAACSRFRRKQYQIESKR